MNGTGKEAGKEQERTNKHHQKIPPYKTTTKQGYHQLTTQEKNYFYKHTWEAYKVFLLAFPLLLPSFAFPFCFLFWLALLFSLLLRFMFVFCFAYPGKERLIFY